MPTDIQQLYEDGLQASTFNEPAYDSLWAHVLATGGMPDAETIAYAFQFADKYAGELVIPFVWVQHIFPGSQPGPGQQRGDCVSHSNKNAALQTMCSEIVSETPDPESGKVEVAPEVTQRGVRNGVLSTCAIYWFAENDNRKNGRGDYVEDGWYTEAAMEVMLKKCGAVVCGPLEGTSEDLTEYSGELAGKYANGVPENVSQAISQNLFRTATRCNSFGEARDFAGKGFGISSDGSQGFSNKRDSNGVSDRKGSWAHAMHEAGYDDRESTHKLYGGPLVLVANSWSKWNSGPRDIRDSADYVPPAHRRRWIDNGLVNEATGNIQIPHGWFWARWSDFKGRRRQAVAGLRGWELKELPNLRGGFR